MTYSQYSGNFRRSSKRRGSSIFKKLLTLALVLLVGSIIYKMDLQIRKADHAAALASKAQLSSAQHSVSQVFDSVTSQNPQISFSASIIDLGNGATQNLGDQGALPAGSVSKVLSAALYLHLVERHRASLSQSINGFSAQTALKRMVNQSDDGVWQSINDFLGHPVLGSYVRQLDLNSYDPDGNSISTADTARFLQRLYDGELLSPSHTRLLLGYMQNTNYEDLITPAVPGGAQIYHKVGELDDNVNDAAIVTKGPKQVVLVIFTDGHGTEDWPTRAGLMQTIARSVFSAYL